MDLCFSPGLCAHAAWVRFPIGLVVVTAADSAAATVQRWSFSAGRLRLTAPSAEGAKGNRVCGRDQRAFRSSFGNLRPHLISLCRSLRWQVAAALSAAVTTTNYHGTAPPLQAEPTMQKHPRQTPAALREGARGRGFSQRSRLPRNPRRLPPPSLFVRGCGERASPWRSPLPRKHQMILL